jgi:hypothetical protein
VLHIILVPLQLLCDKLVQSTYFKMLGLETTTVTSREVFGLLVGVFVVFKIYHNIVRISIGISRLAG